jgi:hypothetical protein
MTTRSCRSALAFFTTPTATLLYNYAHVLCVNGRVYTCDGVVHIHRSGSPTSMQTPSFRAWCCTHHNNVANAHRAWMSVRPPHLPHTRHEYARRRLSVCGMAVTSFTNAYPPSHVVSHGLYQRDLRCRFILNTFGNKKAARDSLHLLRETNFRCKAMTDTCNVRTCREQRSRAPFLSLLPCLARLTWGHALPFAPAPPPVALPTVAASTCGMLPPPAHAPPRA